MRIPRPSWAAVALLLAVAGPADASPMLVDLATFNSDTGGATLTVESFEGFAANATLPSGTAFAGGAFSIGTANDVEIQVNPTASFLTDGSNAAIFTMNATPGPTFGANNDTPVVFSFASPITAFAVDLTDIFDELQAPDAVFYVEVDGVRLAPDVVAGPQAADFGSFVGITDTMGTTFSSVGFFWDPGTIPAVPGIAADVFGMDRVRFTGDSLGGDPIAMPAPAAGLLLASGLLGLALFRARRGRTG